MIDILTTSPRIRSLLFLIRALFAEVCIDCRNVRGLGKSMVVFRLFEKLRCSNKR